MRLTKRMDWHRMEHSLSGMGPCMEPQSQAEPAGTSASCFKYSRKPGL